MAEFMAGNWQRIGKVRADDKRNTDVLFWYRPKPGVGKCHLEAMSMVAFGWLFAAENDT